MDHDYTGRCVTVMGLGRFGGGVGVTRFLAQRGARVLVTDQLPEEKLEASIAQLDGLPGVSLHLGGHRAEDFSGADLVVANPAVKPDHPYLKIARDAGVPVTTEIVLLVRELPNRLRTIGVTGSAGKSTTTAMIGHLLEKWESGSGKWEAGEGKPGGGSAKAGAGRGGVPGCKTWVGGNIGGSLLPVVDQIQAEDWVVLELSSFMLHYLREEKWSPHIAVVTNLSPNHLDWHGTLEHYRDCKQAILTFQDPEADAAVGGPGVHDTFAPRTRRWVDFGSATDTWWKVDPPPPMAVPGEHNQLNARLASVAVELAVGQPAWRSAEALADFAGLPHRLALVGQAGGVRFYDDSKCTTPEAAVLGIESFEPGMVRVILGGYDKGSDFSALASVAAARCAGVYTVGATGDGIAALVEGFMAQARGCHPRALEVVRCGTLERAVAAIKLSAQRGEVVLLSPGCASWDQFENYEQRGARFAALVRGVSGLS